MVGLNLEGYALVLDDEGGAEEDEIVRRAGDVVLGDLRGRGTAGPRVASALAEKRRTSADGYEDGLGRSLNVPG